MGRATMPRTEFRPPSDTPHCPAICSPRLFSIPRPPDQLAAHLPVAVRREAKWPLPNDGKLKEKFQMAFNVVQSLVERRVDASRTL